MDTHFYNKKTCKVDKNRGLARRSATEGFTLIELLTSVALFSVVMIITMGAILGIFEANRKSDSLKTVMDNLNLAVESMSREIRFGSNYHCGGGTLTVPQNCSTGGTQVSFLSSEGVQIAYRINNARIEKSVDGGNNYIAITAPEIAIEDLTYYVIGAGVAPANTIAPKVLIKIRGVAGTKEKTKSDFTLQTLVTQRKIDR